jgi:hypothetical protein
MAAAQSDWLVGFRIWNFVAAPSFVFRKLSDRRPKAILYGLLTVTFARQP